MKRIGIIVIVGVIGIVLYFALRSPGADVDVYEVNVRTVRAFIPEEAETRLAETYTIDMPISGTVQRIMREEGDQVNRGDLLAHVDAYQLEQQMEGIRARIAQIRAQIHGVDVAKPKSEQLEAAVIRVSEMEDNLRIAEQDRQIAQNNFAEAEKDYGRITRLHEEGAVSQQQYDTTKRAYENAREMLEQAKTAEQAARKGLEIARLEEQRLRGSVDDNEYMRSAYYAEIDSLESQLNILRNDLEKTAIRSPINGIILEKYVDDSRGLAAGTPLMLAGDMDTMEIESDILSEEVGQISVGDAVEITGRAFEDNTVMGTVKQIYPSGFKKISSLGIEQQRVKILVEFDNSELGLRPGTSVDIQVITDQADGAVAIPERALFKQNGQWAVFKVTSGTATVQPVMVSLKNDEWAAITEGLEAGDFVIAEPRNDLSDGSAVNVLATINEDAQG